MAENGKGYIILDDGTKVPADKNGVPYPSQVAAEEPLEADYGSYEDEDHTEANYDRFGHDVCYDDFYSNAIRTLQAAGVRFDNTTWVNISNGSLEFTIRVAQD